MGKTDRLKSAQGWTTEIARQAGDDTLNRIRRKKEEKIKNSPENKIFILRNRVNQTLTESNKTYPEQREKNTKDFIDLLKRFICSDYTKYTKSKLKDKSMTTKDLDTFVNYYSGHIENLIKFDNEMVNCVHPKCKTSMVELFLNEIQSQLPVLHSRFAKLVLQKSEQLTVAESVKEA